MTLFLADVLENARHEEKIALALQRVDHMVQLMITVAHSQGFMNMDLGALGSITIDPAGNIGMQVAPIGRDHSSDSDSCIGNPMEFHGRYFEVQV